ncbi:MAG: tetratricopeptide repeat protein [Pyrinomonadaceae bacterium]|nr:tetratricopeptide repeat protein [Pyrinomonadaceae bacterium]
MNSKVITAAILGTIAGAIGGFMLANSLNRSEVNALRAQSENRPAAAQASNRPDDPMNINIDEIKAKVAEADANPSNFGFQKSLGIALYRYGTLKRDADIVTEAARLLERAHGIDSKDYDVIVGLGNSYFDLGYFRKDSANLKRSREYYKLALDQRPKDADVMADVALSYFLDEPADLGRSVDEFQKALQANPKHERALTYLTQTYMRQGNFDEAGKVLEKLKSANPKNESVDELSRLIAAKEAPPIK